MRFHLRCSTRFLASPEEVWALMCSPQALGRPAPGLGRSLDAGAVERALRGEGLPLALDTRLAIAGLPCLSWPLTLQSCTPGQELLSTSDNPLFEGWEHQRLVEQASDATRYLDAVSFVPRLGPARRVADLVRSAFVRQHRRAAEQLRSDARATAVAMLRVATEVADDGTEGFL